MTPWSPTARQAAAGAALCCAATLVTACGSGSPAAAPRHTAVTGHTAASSPSATSSPSQAATGTTSSPASTDPASTHPASSAGTGPAGSDPTPTSPAACLTRYLRVTTGAPQGTAGSVYVDLDFTNLASQPCTLYGYPGVSLATGTPARQVGEAATENPSPPRRLVTLQPHGIASALLRIVDAGNFSTAQCRPVKTSWLQVFPPNQTAVAYVSFPATGCAGPVQLLSVDTVQP